MTNSIYPPRDSARLAHPKMIHGYGFVRQWPFQDKRVVRAGLATIASRNDWEFAKTEDGLPDRAA